MYKRQAWGAPYAAVEGAHCYGDHIVGFSPARNYSEHVREYKYPTNYFSQLVFTGMGKSGRIIPFIRSCDSVAVISGSIETVQEAMVACQEDKKIGIYEGTGSFADFAREFFKQIEENGRGKIVYDTSSLSLVRKLL